MMRVFFIISCLIISSASISQNNFQIILKSGYFDSIPSCKGTYFIEETELIDSVYSQGGNQFIEKSLGALSMLEYTNDCSTYFRLEENSINDKKVLIRIIKLDHIKSSENSSRSVLNYWVDFTLKRKKSGWTIIKIKKYSNS